MLHAYLKDTQNRLTLLASVSGSDAEARNELETMAWEILNDPRPGREPDSEAHLVVAQVLETIDLGDFLVRGPTPLPVVVQACRINTT